MNRASKIYTALIFIFLFAPIAILLVNDYGKKRGCGRGCATCGNRDICYRNKKNKESSQ